MLAEGSYTLLSTAVTSHAGIKDAAHQPKCCIASMLAGEGQHQTDQYSCNESWWHAGLLPISMTGALLA